MSTETPEQFLKRKHDQAQSIIEEAIKANALSMPTVVDGINNIGQPTITITFSINEQKLHAFREGTGK